MATPSRSRDAIRMHASALVRGMLAQSEALATLEHQVTKGTLRELLMSELLSVVVPEHLGLSSGIIINRKGDPHRQSNQSDIVIYDKRIMPPFIHKHNLGIVPVESVIGVVEVKTSLIQREFDSAVGAAKHTVSVIAKGMVPPPIMCVFAFRGSGLRALQGGQGKARKWLNANASPLRFIALAGRHSWIRFDDGRGWVYCRADPRTHEEVKRFVAVLVDNCRTRAEARWRHLTDRHQDWLSAYIRG